MANQRIGWRANTTPAAGTIRIIGPTLNRYQGAFSSPKSIVTHQTSIAENLRTGRLRALRHLSDIARAANFSCFATLTFANPVEPREGMNLIRKVQRTKSIKALLTKAKEYVIVPERDAHERFHIHMLCHPDLAAALQTSWKHGFIDIKPTSFDELGKICGYLSKTFDKEDRPTQRRYYASRGLKPATSSLLLDDAPAINRHLDDHRNGRELVEDYESNSLFRHHRVVVWNPHEIMNQ